MSINTVWFQGLPTRIRQQLINAKLVQVARFIDVLYSYGVQPGDVFTMNTALEIGNTFKIGKNTLRDQILKSVFPLGNRAIAIFKQVQDIKVFSPDLTYVYAESIQYKSKSTDQETSKSPCASAHYVMPAFEYLFDIAVKPRYNKRYTLCRDDLLSTKAYKKAIQRSYTIQYAGVRQPLKTRARMTGVGRSTVKTYDRELGTIAKDTILEQEITYENLEVVPEDLSKWKHANYPVVLLDETGRSYPPVREEAEKLLQMGDRVWYKRPGPREYSPGSTYPVVPRYVGVIVPTPDPDS